QLSDYVASLHDALPILLLLLQETLKTKKWLYQQIAGSREKDYTNPFRKMVYANEQEMDIVVGSLKDNAFINKQAQECAAMEEELSRLEKQIIKLKKHVE